MTYKEFKELFERSRDAWASGKLLSVSARQQKIAIDHLDEPIEKFMGDLSDMRKKLEFLPPIDDEFIYGFNDEHYLDVLLTNHRFLVKDRKTKKYDVFNLLDISTCLESGWWSKTIKVVLNDGTEKVYKGLHGSIKLEYIMLAISNSKKGKHASDLGDPKPYNGQGRYVFVSYHHGDFYRIKSVLNYLTKRGINFWFDLGIQGGEEWTNVIEERINSSSSVVTFLSESSIESKWVTRETKYADSRNKAIIPVKLEKVQLKGGLGLILSQYQIIDIDSKNFLKQLVGSVSK